MPTTSQIETSVHIERHYAGSEIADMRNLSPDKVRELLKASLAFVSRASDPVLVDSRPFARFPWGHP